VAGISSTYLDHVTSWAMIMTSSQLIASANSHLGNVTDLLVHYNTFWHREPNCMITTRTTLIGLLDWTLLIAYIGSVRYGWSWNSSASTRGVIRPWRFSPPLVHILLAWSSPVRSMQVDKVGVETRALRRTSRVGLWADPILFLLYTADLIQLIERHDLSPHLYADDTQVCGLCPPSTTAQLLNRMSECLADVAAWMRSNRLQLNTAETEVIWCSSTLRQHQIPQSPLVFGSSFQCVLFATWEFTYFLIWWCGCTLQRLFRAVLRCSDSFTASGGLCQIQSCSHLSWHWCWRSSTMAAPRWQDCLPFSLTGCSRCWMQLCD